MCELCDLEDVENCLACDPDNPDVCLSCDSGYYLDSEIQEDLSVVQVCSDCPSGLTLDDGCARCSATSCLECQTGFYEVVDELTGYVTCASCDVDNSDYTLEPNRCSQCSTTDSTECLFCDVGFLGSTSNPDSCQLKCDDGQYPSVTFTDQNDNENFISSTQCLSCHSSCATCIGSGSSECTSCPSTYNGDSMYLTYSDLFFMTGSCSARQTSASNPTFDIFVTGEEPSDYDYYIKN